ncbi:cyclic 2,3-diphosphoglycerate synthase [Myxococcota bacterium]|nr:cyclic 2,3-diphosphoglycerate synthase [Myxococcota bacterium]MBU1899906.1 cyclic 2,3-diphosphoglycerate synthase [Myxococcota bacterium]
MPRKVIIIGAAGRDFHNFNTVFRGDDTIEVVAFTAAQIPDIDGRAYPAELAGPGYPEGIPIIAEDQLGALIDSHRVDEVIFSYSDVTYHKVMSLSAIAMAHGADFRLIGDLRTMVPSNKPVVSICAVRTGCGKSQTTRRVAELLKAAHKRLVAVRHPMPYGDLVAQRVQRFAVRQDLIKHKCTIEEMEEYEPHIDTGTVVYAGVDYEAILRQAEAEADVVLWDGGNNDLPFFKSDLEIVVVDPHRPGDELRYFPGEVNLRRADVVVINKIDTARPEDIDLVRENIQRVNPKAIVIDAASPVSVDDPAALRGKRVLVVEDGPTLTHGEMKIGAGVVAAKRFGAAEIVDPRPYLKGSLIDTFEKYPDIGHILPAMGYGAQQMADLQATINAVDCDLVVIGTPIDLGRHIDLNKPSMRVYYKLQEIGAPTLEEIIARFIEEHC